MVRLFIRPAIYHQSRATLNRHSPFTVHHLLLVNVSAPSVSGEGGRRAPRAVGARGRLPPLDLEDGDGLDAVLNHDGRARVELALGLFGGPRRRVAQEDLARQRVLLQPRGEVDRVADGRVFRPPLRADVAHGRHARVQADADGDLAQAL